TKQSLSHIPGAYNFFIGERCYGAIRPCPISRGNVMMRKTLSVLALSALAPSAAMADAFPSKPVTIVVSVPAGGTIDAIARMVAKDLGESMGKQFIVENRPGANGNIA